MAMNILLFGPTGMIGDGVFHELRDVARLAPTSREMWSASKPTNLPA
jgi:hypothetical protein